MPIARVQLPNGQIARFDVPDGTAPEQIEAYAAGLMPGAGSSAAPAPADNSVPPPAGSPPSPPSAAPSAPVGPSSALVQPTAQDPYGGVAGRSLGLLETPIALASHAVAPIAGLWANVLSGGGVDQQNAVSRAVQNALTYQPRTPLGQEATADVEDALSGLPPVMAGPHGTIGMGADTGMLPAARALFDRVNALSDARTAASPTNISNLAAASQKNALTIQAASDAWRLGIKINPAESNPSPDTKTRVAIAGGGGVVNRTAAFQNREVPTEVAKREMGIDPNQPLTPQAFEDARAVMAAPYQEATASIPQAQISPEVIKGVEDLRPNQKLVGGEASAGKVDQLVDSAQHFLAQNPSGADLLANIQNLRRNSRLIYEQQKKGIAPSPEQLSIADTQKALADKFEDVIDQNVSDPALLSRFRQARVDLAKSYAYQDATNFATGLVDPQKLATPVIQGKPITGDIAALGRVAGRFPDVLNVEATKPDVPILKRTGSLAAAGYMLGGHTGAGVGAVIGAGAGRAAMANVLSEGYQSAKAIPQDWRPSKSPAPNPGQLNFDQSLPVPYDWSNATAPNWVPGNNAPGFSWDQPPEPRQPQLPNSAPSTRYFNDPLQQGQRPAPGVAEGIQASQERAAAAAKPPTSGEVILEWDPSAGKFRVASAGGVKGATPEVWQADTGANLASAAQKISNGQRFALSAAEKVAWDKTRVDMAEADPAYRTLSDRDVFDKMQDRADSQALIAKAREKAATFDQIAQRAQDQKAVREAKANRERMMDLAEQLEDLYHSQQRASASGTGQGPKTRAFKLANPSNIGDVR